MSNVHATVDASGRLLIPREQRKQLGLSKGGRVTLSIEDGDLRVRSVEASVRRLQALGREILSGEESSVDAFLAWRREEASKEAAEFGDVQVGDE
jgi:bifunctional DNA-binding transcriptional regulator/antitoxin component of YhaV-PrlF toxin-antitoxin module